MKYYIASKLENHAAHNRLRDSLTAIGHTITYDWTHHGAVYRHGLERIREVAKLETLGVLNADVVIVLWPGGRGTHTELGMALGAGKPVIFISDDERHHQATTETCAFYHHPLVTRGRTVAEVPALLDRLNTTDHESPRHGGDSN
ncbi:Nucleoside 2-deoxyribosyltransferase [Opitutaceae bacterium TAV1]|nr:Nucleoside 2-deoxyribosyltransferase [Opitutaceae bacterium TAV1]